MSMQFETLKLSRATEAAYTNIRQKIFDGELQPTSLLG